MYDEDKCSLDRMEQWLTTSGAAADLFILRPRQACWPLMPEASKGLTKGGRDGTSKAPKGAASWQCKWSLDGPRHWHLAPCHASSHHSA